MAWSHSQTPPFPGEGALAELSKRAGNPYAITNMSDLTSFSHGLTGVDQPKNYLWSYVLTGMFLFVCLVTFVLNIQDRVTAKMRQLYGMAAPNPGQQRFWESNENWYWRLLKKHLFYPPLWKERHNKEYHLTDKISMGTLPGRFHLILLGIYFGANIAYCLILPYDVEEVAITIANLRGRSGTLACLNLIPTILFALRNNPLIWIMNTPYDTFNLFHRWSARITVLEAVVHTLAWAANTYRAGKMEQINKVLATTPSYQWGMVGTIAFVVLVISAWSPIRRAFYETFLNLHRLMVVLSLAGVYFHVDLHKLPQLPWMWGIILLYVFELLMRTYTIVRYNVKSKQNATIEVEALSGEASRVTVTLARPWHPKPGCHAHLYIPALSLGGSHPFSIAWNHPNDGGPSDPVFDKKLNLLPVFEKPTIQELSKRKMTNKISFICRAREGMTRRLFDTATKHQSEKGSLWKTWGAIEGPYGGHDKLDSYGTLVLFAGGVGITHQVNFIYDQVQKHELGTTAVRRILLVWTVPNLDCMEWVRPWMNEILRLPSRKQLVRIKIFVTKPKSALELKDPSATITLHPKKPPVSFLIRNEIENREGAIAVTVCGPGALADSVRIAVKENVDCGSIDFIEEAFSY